MKDEIKFPAEFISMNDVPVPVATIKRERMEEILREAIKTDRQQRGNPVYQASHQDALWQDCSLERYEYLCSPEYSSPDDWRLRVLFTAPQPAAPEQDSSPLVCDYCNTETHDPWHGSGTINGETSKHIHACDTCRHLLPHAPAQELSDNDGFGSAEHWKEKAQYWAAEAHKLRQQALRGEPLDGIIQPASPKFGEEQ